MKIKDMTFEEWKQWNIKRADREYVVYKVGTTKYIIEFNPCSRSYNRNDFIVNITDRKEVF